ncbi:MAG: hypothetical protein NTAFB01_22430 [Nitrospira sp.]
MATIYTSGKYLEVTQTWHAEDSPWKAAQIWKILAKNYVQPQRIAEIGCGAGGVLRELSRMDSLSNTHFKGYDISPQAIQLANRQEAKNIEFYCEDLLSERNTAYFDVLLAIDVYEHIPDYMGFLVKCKQKAAYKIYHIPLDLHVSSVLRNAFIGTRYTLGHLHYFTADSAIATLKDTGHKIVDWFYTNPAIDLFKEHPSIRKGMANVPRYLCSKLSVPLTARVFGGYSLLVLAK